MITVLSYILKHMHIHIHIHVCACTCALFFGDQRAGCGVGTAAFSAAPAEKHPPASSGWHSPRRRAAGQRGPRPDEAEQPLALRRQDEAPGAPAAAGNPPLLAAAPSPPSPGSAWRSPGRLLGHPLGPRLAPSPESAAASPLLGLQPPPPRSTWPSRWSPLPLR